MNIFKVTIRHHIGNLKITTNHNILFILVNNFFLVNIYLKVHFIIEINAVGVLL